MIGRSFAETGRWDVATLEQGLKAALMKDGACILESLLNACQPAVDPPKPGERCYKFRPKRVQSVLGPLILRRDYYYGSAGGRAPLDEKLGLVDSYTPGLQQLMCRAGAMDTSYEEAARSLLVYGGINVPDRQIQRMVNHLAPEAKTWAQTRKPDPKQQLIPVMYVSYDSTGVPMIREELVGRKGKQPDGTAKTREIKLGCVFTQHGCDEKGIPLRDTNSSSYVASFADAEDFGALMRHEAIRRGMAKAKVVVVIGDGAAWIWTLAKINFPFAVQILDFYHACEHLFSLCKALSSNPADVQAQFKQWKTSFKKNGVLKVIAQAEALLKTRAAVDPETVRSEIGYLQTNACRMLYRTYRQKGYFIGSGVVEAGCKTVIGQRAKQSGMFWTVSGSENVLSFRCLSIENALNEYWKQRKIA